MMWTSQNLRKPAEIEAEPDKQKQNRPKNRDEPAETIQYQIRNQSAVFEGLDYPYHG